MGKVIYRSGIVIFSQEIDEDISAVRVHESLKTAVVEIHQKIEVLTKMAYSIYLVLYEGANIASYLKENNDAKIRAGDVFTGIPLIS